MVMCKKYNDWSFNFKCRCVVSVVVYVCTDQNRCSEAQQGNFQHWRIGHAHQAETEETHIALSSTVDRKTLWDNKLIR